MQRGPRSAEPCSGAVFEFGSVLAVCSGDLGGEMIAGGESKKEVSKLIDYLVIGDGPYADFLNGIMTSKPAKAIELVAEGYGVEIIPEHEFLTLLYS